MLTIKNTRKQVGPGFFEAASVELETVKSKDRLKSYSNSSRVSSGTNITTNIAFATTINIHPKADPREPRFVAPEREEKLDQDDAAVSKCCWPFSLCC